MKDLEFVKEIMTDPDVYPSISDDSSGPAEDFTPEIFLSNGIFKVLSPNPGSVFVFVPFVYRIYWVHSCVLPGYRGAQAVDAMKSACKWMFDEQHALKILGIVPAFNRQARVFAVKSGFKATHIIKDSYQKDGVVHDLHFFEKGRYQCQQ